MCGGHQHCSNLSDHRWHQVRELVHHTAFQHPLISSIVKYLLLSVPLAVYFLLKIHHRQWLCEAAEPQLQSGHGHLGGGPHLQVRTRSSFFSALQQVSVITFFFRNDLQIETKTELGFLALCWVVVVVVLVLAASSLSRSEAQQRAGRAGRTSAGKCFRIYNKEFWERSMPDFTVPEIQRSSLTAVVLTLKCLGVHDVIR